MMGKKHFFITAAMAVLAAFLMYGCCNQATPPQNEQIGANQKESTPEAAVGKSPYADMVLKLGRIPFTNAATMVQEHEKFANYLAKEVGVKQVRLQTAQSYEEIMNSLESGAIDIGWLATMTAAEVRNHKDIEFLVKPIRFGLDTYGSIIIARKDSGIKTLQDLKGKKFAWIEKDSASGYLFPKAELLKRGIDPEKDFSETGFLGKHDKVVYNVFLKKYDAGACYDDARFTLVGRKKESDLTPSEKAKIDELFILVKLQDIPNEPIVVRKDLPEEIKQRLKAALLKLSQSTEEGKKVLEKLTDVEGFKPVAPKDYDYVDEVQRILDEYKSKSEN